MAAPRVRIRRSDLLYEASITDNDAKKGDKPFDQSGDANRAAFKAWRKKFKETFDALRKAQNALNFQHNPFNEIIYRGAFVEFAKTSGFISWNLLHPLFPTLENHDFAPVITPLSQNKVNLLNLYRHFFLIAEALDCIDDISENDAKDKMLSIYKLASQFKLIPPSIPFSADLKISKDHKTCDDQIRDIATHVKKIDEQFALLEKAKQTHLKTISDRAKQIKDARKKTLRDIANEITNLNRELELITDEKDIEAFNKRKDALLEQIKLFQTANQIPDNILQQAEWGLDAVAMQQPELVAQRKAILKQVILAYDQLTKDLSTQFKKYLSEFPNPDFLLIMIETIEKIHQAGTTEGNTFPSLNTTALEALRQCFDDQPKVGFGKTRWNVLKEQIIPQRLLQADAKASLKDINTLALLEEWKQLDQKKFANTKGEIEKIRKIAVAQTTLVNFLETDRKRELDEMRKILTELRDKPLTPPKDEKHFAAETLTPVSEPPDSNEALATDLATHEARIKLIDPQVAIKANLQKKAIAAAEAAKLTDMKTASTTIISTAATDPTVIPGMVISSSVPTTVVRKASAADRKHQSNTTDETASVDSLPLPRKASIPKLDLPSATTPVEQPPANQGWWSRFKAGATKLYKKFDDWTDKHPWIWGFFKYVAIPAGVAAAFVFTGGLAAIPVVVAKAGVYASMAYATSASSVGINISAKIIKSCTLSNATPVVPIAQSKSDPPPTDSRHGSSTRDLMTRGVASAEPHAVEAPAKPRVVKTRRPKRPVPPSPDARSNRQFTKMLS